MSKVRFNTKGDDIYIGNRINKDFKKNFSFYLPCLTLIKSTGHLVIILLKDEGIKSCRLEYRQRYKSQSSFDARP